MRLTDIFRHPIKAHGREALTTVPLIAGQSMPFDRHWAVAHEAAKLGDGGWVSCNNFTRGAKAPGLMAMTARLENGVVHFRHPDLDDLSINPDDAGDAARFLLWSAPLVPENRAKSVGIVALPDRGMTDTNFPSISFNTHASLSDLSSKAGVDLSMHRWRGNFWIEGTAPWEELDWIGHEATLGHARIRFVEPIERCRATTANPETGKVDYETLALLNSQYGHQNFGVFAEVIQDGVVSTNDELVIL